MTRFVSVEAVVAPGSRPASRRVLAAIESRVSPAATVTTRPLTGGMTSIWPMWSSSFEVELVGPPEGHHADAEVVGDAGQRVARLDLVVLEELVAAVVDGRVDRDRHDERAVVEEGARRDRGRIGLISRRAPRSSGRRCRWPPTTAVSRRPSRPAIVEAAVGPPIDDPHRVPPSTRRTPLAALGPAPKLRAAATSDERGDGDAAGTGRARGGRSQDRRELGSGRAGHEPGDADGLARAGPAMRRTRWAPARADRGLTIRARRGRVRQSSRGRKRRMPRSAGGRM